MIWVRSGNYYDSEFDFNVGGGRNMRLAVQKIKDAGRTSGGSHPGGLSDVPLIAADLGINSPSLIVIQVVRLFVADAIMPQVCYTVAQLLG